MVTTLTATACGVNYTVPWLHGQSFHTAALTGGELAVESVRGKGPLEYTRHVVVDVTNCTVHNNIPGTPDLEIKAWHGVHPSQKRFRG